MIGRLPGAVTTNDQTLTDRLWTPGTTGLRLESMFFLRHVGRMILLREIWARLKAGSIKKVGNHLRWTELLHKEISSKTSRGLNDIADLVPRPIHCGIANACFSQPRYEMQATKRAFAISRVSGRDGC